MFNALDEFACPVVGGIGAGAGALIGALVKQATAITILEAVQQIMAGARSAECIVRIRAPRGSS